MFREIWLVVPLLYEIACASAKLFGQVVSALADKSNQRGSAAHACTHKSMGGSSAQVEGGKRQGLDTSMLENVRRLVCFLMRAHMQAHSSRLPP